MIKQITMKNCASYNETGVLIDDCDRVNFIYGHNGSGKSTISNYLANFHNTKYAECSIVWDLGAASNILVYNKNFRERNLQSTDMPGVFTLGEATAEQLAELERLRKSRAQREKEYHDYAILWSEVKENSGASAVSLQNAMRRILENFFGTLGNTNSRAILDYFDSIEERSICRSLFSWANDGSHSIPDDLEFSEKTDAPDKYRKVFKDIFYKTHNEYHYDRMMK